MPFSYFLDSPLRRIAITKPPRDWFHTIPARMFEIYRRVLVGLNFSVFEVEVDAFLPPDMGRITSLVAALRDFDPDLAIGLPFGTYALICRLPPQRNGWRPNLFVDVLEIPTVFIWDHAPVQEADQLLVLPHHPAESSAGALQALRRALSNPLMVHWSRDSGQTRIMRQLGLVRPEQVVQTATPALPEFTPTTTGAIRKGAAFIGNLYQDTTGFGEPELERLQNEAIARSIERSTALWDEIADGIAALPDGQRRNLALEQDQTFFWRFAHQLIEHVGQTNKRLHFLGAAGIPITMFGEFREDAPNVPLNLHANSERFRFGSELASAFASHSVIVDVLSPAFVNGYSSKPINGFASGGFVLVDRKRDFVDAFGELGRAVSFVDADDLAAKADRFLSKPRERRELGDAMRAEIRANHLFINALRRVLQSAAEIVRAARDGRASAASHAMLQESSLPLLDLLPAVQTHVHWHEARVERGLEDVVITTSPDPWAYSAEIPIGETWTALREPHVQIELVVEVGRVGVCVVRFQTGELVSEQLVSATPRAVSLVIELQLDSLCVLILRNATEGPSRVRLMKAVLCERPDFLDLNRKRPPDF